VDISHGVTPFEIAEGAYLIAQAYPYFPKKTVHVVVVDPGVGTRAGRSWWKPRAVFRGAG
jgi:S-adenosylmethionine hydrolase